MKSSAREYWRTPVCLEDEELESRFRVALRWAKRWIRSAKRYLKIPYSVGSRGVEDVLQDVMLIHYLDLRSLQRSSPYPRKLLNIYLKSAVSKMTVNLRLHFGVRDPRLERKEDSVRAYEKLARKLKSKEMVNLEIDEWDRIPDQGTLPPDEILEIRDLQGHLNRTSRLEYYLRKSKFSQESLKEVRRLLKESTSREERRSLWPIRKRSMGMNELKMTKTLRMRM
jgi:hypothetical protein